MSEPVIAAKSPSVMTLEPGTYYWCRCGKSANQPFCDGSHGGSELTPQAFEISETKTVALCQCKHSKNTPFCDGTHADL
ncbi:MAG: cytochrome C551 [Zetaproteobacteria bacterium CG02_land_8_20_14_3_00_50_9]|nr:MAG: cytochrome C551 [Zetaproteobacteria bacterium CG17_big_fil_post_rev_8_21_14_2_50_50_13]PIV30468.1 MAG: cytochrome C551 [Zetaproteobacteria bacterium CG02_land_8_20_14_3_00_50_9]PIY54890.1 MAG: cytochrome C551 [Zetaproteobacteria bacterium CG_4_10_14_0_8_um_filter_49_80]